MRTARICAGHSPPSAIAGNVWRRVRSVDGRWLSGFGFPSGHASGATALAVVIVLLAFAAFPPRHPLRVVVVIAAVVYALAVAAARVVVGAHFPLDVLGAALLGTVATLVAILVLLPERATARDLARSAAPPA